MAINSIMGPAVQGIQNGIHGLRRVASEIASNQITTPAKPTDLTRAMVEMQQHSIQTKASIKSLKSIDGAIGTLFDERV
ncbi:MAG: hydrolase [Pseudomonadota bacterium]